MMFALVFLNLPGNLSWDDHMKQTTAYRGLPFL
jgi:hypothetical protein